MATLAALFWPIRRGEYRKFILMFFISFLTCFNYYLLKITKDTVLITAPYSGAEAIPFVKVWAILPAAFLMTFCFTRLSNFFNQRAVFYAVIWLFVFYFVLFIAVLYPNRELLTPTSLAHYLETLLPKGLGGLTAIIRNWILTTFYVMSEMWSTMVMTILFWGLANDVTSVKDAKRFYGLLYFGTNLSGIIAGIIASALSMHIFNPSLPFGRDAWDQSITFTTLIVIGVSLICMLLYWWLNQSGLGYTEDQLIFRKKAPIKMGIRKNFSYLAKSKYLTCIAFLVISLNIVINLAEVVWKDQVKQLYPSPAEFNAYMASINFWIAIIAAFISLFVSGNLIRIVGWTKSALVAPILALVTGGLFFAVLLIPSYSLVSFCAFLGSSPLGIAILLGSLQNCLLRGTKTSLIDSTKELAFIPLNPESRLKGKAAIDGLVSRLGKSGSAFMYQILLICFGSILGSVQIVALLTFLTIIVWISCINSLGKQFNQLTSSPQATPSTSDQESPLFT